ncbi:MAG: DUF5063 domain-containing protein [Planctomycetes bacterium]|nr:DUF5063 domain-containing protein [Planctomycetota bacterium]
MKIDAAVVLVRLGVESHPALLGLVDKLSLLTVSRCSGGLISIPTQQPTLATLARLLVKDVGRRGSLGMDAVDLFAVEARRFCSWTKQGLGSGPSAARGALDQIARIYAAGLGLPSEWLAECSDHDAEAVPDDEVRAVVSAASGLPIDVYWEVFDPVSDDATDGRSVAGSLADDISDIYRDVARGLLEYEAGRRSEAHWEWAYHLRHHWGAHATSAMRALHWWCREHDTGRAR